MEKDLEAWITMARVYLVNNQQYPVVRHACKESCAQNILSTGMMELPAEIRAQQAHKAN